MNTNNLTRQQRRKMLRQGNKNKWYIKGWQKMTFIRTDKDQIPPHNIIRWFANDIYDCIVREMEQFTYLSIKRRDRLPIWKWQHLQQIKNDICGEEREAIQIFPAMSRIVDAANQYHLWVLKNGERVPIGFNGRLVDIEGQPQFPADHE